MGRSTKKRSRAVKTKRFLFFFFGIALGTTFGIYLLSLYTQLTNAFSQQDQFIPTRIYSDVTRIAPSQARGQIEYRLKNLGYTYSPSNAELRFQLHPLEYPTYLVPDHFAQLEKRDQAITLHFDQTGPQALLQAIELNGQEIPDLYLEPELIATLSQNGESRKEIRTYLNFEEVPASLWKAIIAIEDQHFLEHKGLDPRGIARAIWINLKTFSLAQGGSTITQQLVKNLMARRTKNIFRKTNELFLALFLEARFEKEQILERYLNEVYLGQVGNLEVHGVAEGAKHFFGKRVDELNLAEIAMMAGLIRGPGFYSPYRYKARAVERQRLVLKKMVETGLIAQDEAKSALEMPLRLAPPQSSANKAPFYSDYVKAELLKLFKDQMTESEMIEAGFKVYTTLNPEMNSIAQRAVSDGIVNLEKQLKLPPGQRLEGALASVEQSTGYIRTLIGGRNYAQSNFNRILNMRRQVGSTFKPIVYLAALQKGEDTTGVPYGPGRPVEDAPWTLVYDRGRQKWSPRNYEKTFQGWTTFRTALSHSINTVAAKLGHEVGLENVLKVAQNLGIESPLPLVPSLSLGVAELTPIELLRVYATLANHGLQNQLTVIRGITHSDNSAYFRATIQSRQVVETGPTDLLTDLLQSVFTDGTARSAQRLGFDHPAAGKTGTTSNYRDAWFAGYTPQLTTVVWVGMDQTAPSASQSGTHPKPVALTGGGSALPIWANFMKQALKTEAPLPFPQSPLISDVQIDRHTGKSASSSCPTSQVIIEKYLRDHEPRDKTCETNWPPPTPQVIQE
jgi:penicillin-binding protein 1B